MAFQCPHCTKTFADENGRWCHVRAKHGRGLAKAVKPPPRDDAEPSMGDVFRAMKDRRRRVREELGRECPDCPPNRNASILLPGQRCRVDGYRDPRPSGS